MRKRLVPVRAALFFSLSLMSATVPALAGPAEDGTAAFRRGDYARAIALWRPIAGRDANVQNMMGIMYMKGVGVPQNSAEALRWFARAAQSGSPVAQNNLGGLYRDGRGVPRDYSKSATFFAAAAQNGNAAAQFNLGLLYQNGQGVRQDPMRAFVWYSMAAAQNVPHALADRDRVAGQMSGRDAMLAAQKAQQCARTRYKSCG